MDIRVLTTAACAVILGGVIITCSARAEKDTASVSASPTPTPTVVSQETEAFDTPDPDETPLAAEILGDNLKKGVSGDEVILLQMRLRDLGYFNYKITNYYGDLTVAAVKAFQKENELSADGVLGPETYERLFSNDAVRKPIKAIATPTPEPTPVPEGYVSKVPKGEMIDWDVINKKWERGENYTVIDVDTGAKMVFQRVGGYLHADVEPLTAEDTARLKKCYGGSWNWSRRAVVVNIDGTWVAASINGYPHGKETVANNDMTGQVCIHFLNSRTHIRNLKDPDHQAMVRKAAGE